MKFKKLILILFLITVLCAGLWGFSGNLGNLFSEADKDADGAGESSGETKFARRSVESVKINQILLLTKKVKLASK